LIRVIPRLDIKGPHVVKGIHLEGLRVLGVPEFFARRYYEEGADEILFMDAVASLYGRNSLLQLIEKVSQEIFIPLTVGGGIRTVEDVRAVLRVGADKVALNTAAVRQPHLIQEASQRFGSSTIVVAIDAIQKEDGRYEVFTDYGRESTGLDAVEWAIRAVALGAGELLVTSIDREGTGRGYDEGLILRVVESVPVPVIACGGAGKAVHLTDVVTKGKADAVAVASMLHYNLANRFPIEKPDKIEEGNTVFLEERRGSRVFPGTSLGEIKAELSREGIPCRVLGGPE
jgi:cyclase